MAGEIDARAQNDQARVLAANRACCLSMTPPKEYSHVVQQIEDALHRIGHELGVTIVIA